MARPGARNSHGRNRRESSLAFADFEVRGARIAVFSEAIFMKRKGLWNGELSAPCSRLPAKDHPFKVVREAENACGRSSLMLSLVLVDGFLYLRTGCFGG
jgi:hypothetical protein